MRTASSTTRSQSSVDGANDLRDVAKPGESLPTMFGAVDAQNQEEIFTRQGPNRPAGDRDVARSLQSHVGRMCIGSRSVEIPQ